MSSPSSDAEVDTGLFTEDTLDRKALHADVLTRMFGEADPETVQTLGRYQVVRKIGVGGMGVVYLAHDPELDRHVAIKLLRSRFDRQPTEVTEQRLREEARAMARLRHPNVVHVYDVGHDDDRLFLAMEYVEGSSLARWARRTRPWREVLATSIAAGEGLWAAHEAGLVHRDFKPDNVLIGKDGVVKVTDFGIALAMESWSTEGESDEASGAGTLPYMSPEQILSQPIDARSDQFSFCVTLYELLLGGHPFGRSSREEMVAAIIEGRRRPLPRGHEVPSWVVDAVLRGLSSDPAERWPSMKALLEVLRHDPVVRRRRRLAAGAALVGASVLAFAVGRNATPQPEDPCIAGSRQVQQVWSDERRQAVGERFQTVGGRYGEASFSAIQAPLEQWGKQWSDAYLGLCRDRHERSAERYDQRMSCLANQSHHVEALVGLLAEADAALVDDAVRLSNRLPDAKECLDRQLNTVPPPPEIAAEVAEMRKELAGFRAQLSANRAGELTPRLAELAAQADALGYAPLQAEIARLESIDIGVRGDMDKAVERLKVAFDLALSSGHDYVALDAANRLIIKVSAGTPTPTSEAAREHWNDLAKSLSARLDYPLKHEIDRYTSHMHALWQHRRGKDVPAETDAAIELLRKTVGLDHPYAIDILEFRARAQLYSMKPVESLETLDRVDAMRTELVGADHPLGFTALLMRADALSILGRHEEETEVLNRLLRVQETGHHLENDRLNMLLSRLGSVEDMLGNHDKARQIYMRLLGDPVPEADALDENHVIEVSNLCFILYQLEEYEEALRMCERSRLAARRLWPDGSSTEALVFNNEALIARAQGQFERSLELDQQALALCERVELPDLRATVYSWIGVGESLLALGRDAEAIEPLTRALDMRREAGVTPPELGEAECLAARARWESEPKAREQLRAQAKSGLARLQAGGSAWARSAAACAAWLDERPPS
ncbi:MAG: serine/threonine-protein kinase [Myxococcota bacterium]